MVGDRLVGLYGETTFLNCPVTFLITGCLFFSAVSHDFRSCPGHGYSWVMALGVSNWRKTSADSRSTSRNKKSDMIASLVACEKLQEEQVT